jgi:hypothetical protein
MKLSHTTHHTEIKYLASQTECLWNMTDLLSSTCFESIAMYINCESLQIFKFFKYNIQNNGQWGGGGDNVMQVGKVRNGQRILVKA